MMLRLYRAQRRRIARQERKERDAETRQRLRIVLLLDQDNTPTQIHQSTGAARSTVYRVAGRFIEAGEDGLRDRRPEVAPVKVTVGSTLATATAMLSLPLPPSSSSMVTLTS